MNRLWVLVLLAAGGCGQQPERVPVYGRVTLDGAPVQKIAVNFTPTGDTKGSGGIAGTDENGRYDLMDVRGVAGVRVGEYKVSVYPLSTTKIGDPLDVVAPPAKRGDVPGIFLDANQSPLRAIVPEGGATIDILLTKSGEGASTKVSPPEK